MPNKKVYLYDSGRRPYQRMDNADIVIEKPIKYFSRDNSLDQMGESLLTKKNIGKYFFVRIPKSTNFGLCEFLGYGKRTFPFSNELMKPVLHKNNWFNFKQAGKNGVYFSVEIMSISVIPAGKKIGNVYLEKKEGRGINAYINVYLLTERKAYYSCTEPDIIPTIRKIGTLKFSADNVWVIGVLKHTKNLNKALKYIQKKYPNG